jgi:hypothetical protein
MSGLDLPEFFLQNQETLLRKKRTRVSTCSATPPTTELLILVSTTINEMAQKTLRKFSVPAIANVPTRPVVNFGNKNFELQTGLITMVRANPFCGLPSEDANVHLQQFLELCDTIVIKDVALEAIKLCLFPFALMAKAK